jgi:hypothetical protein
MIKLTTQHITGRDTGLLQIATVRLLKRNFAHRFGAYSRSQSAVTHDDGRGMRYDSNLVPTSHATARASPACLDLVNQYVQIRERERERESSFCQSQNYLRRCARQSTTKNGKPDIHDESGSGRGRSEKTLSYARRFFESLVPHFMP